jgi:hypothetical protein
MNSEDLKRIVKEKYGKIARQSDHQNQISCCGPMLKKAEENVKKPGYPEILRKDAEIYIGCVSGVIAMDEYFGIIKQKGFTNIQIHKQKEISLPDELLTKHLNCDELEVSKVGKMGIYSITVSGYKQ